MHTCAPHTEATKYALALECVAKGLTSETKCREAVVKHAKIFLQIEQQSLVKCQNMRDMMQKAFTEAKESAVQKVDLWHTAENEAKLLEVKANVLQRKEALIGNDWLEILALLDKQESEEPPSKRFKS